MGCDGGTIPKRDELVKIKKKPEKKDKEAELSFRWRHCAVSQQVLQQPIVGCSLGRLYSKSAVIECLLDKDNIPAVMSHIKSLKDIKDLKLTKNPAHKAQAEKTEGAIDERGSPYICPIIGLEMSGRFRFVFIWTCGCVMSERAFKEVKMKLCHLCMQPFEETDVVIINGTDEDVELMKNNMVLRQSKAKSLKKNKTLKTDLKKDEVKTSESSVDETVKTTIKISVDETIKTETSLPLKNENSTISIKNDIPGTSKLNGTATSTCRKILNIKYKNGSNNKRLATSAIEDPLYKKAKEEYSIAKDPKATDVYKSLFTSHHSDKTQQRAHWVTYNPFYN